MLRSWLETKEESEMISFFNKRTQEHIARVQKYAKKIAEAYPELQDVVTQARNHDQSKWEEPEYTPYLHITWRYKQQADGVDYEIPKEIDHNAATLHHIKNNRHHPEFHDEKAGEGSLNQKDRDEVPEKPTKATDMTDVDIAEMVADWLAMSEEKETNPLDWADKNVNQRWLFTPKQKGLIYKLIRNIPVSGN